MYVENEMYVCKYLCLINNPNVNVPVLVFMIFEFGIHKMFIVQCHYVYLSVH